MNGLISICIPTYRRPDIVRQAVNSAISQTYQAIEILVSDDSCDDHTEQALTDLIVGGRILYIRNDPALGQAMNVNQLFDRAAGDRLILLHDDDILLPNAVTLLVQCFESDPTIITCYGKQYLMDRDGVLDELGSEVLNLDYNRSSSHAGRQQSAMISALTAQFPNDAYMIRADVARKVRYRNAQHVGDACDFDFGLRLASFANGFYFLDQYTAKYRITRTSVGTGNNYTNLTFDLIAAVDLPPELEPLRRECLQRYVKPAINRWLAIGDRRSALRVYMSSTYTWKSRFSAQGIIQAVLLLLPTTISRYLVGILKQYHRS